ncbi:MAG: hypothetical protein LBB83_07690, partial [Treponema sp.]|nr:hypothetical protein [Treponema sp.]
GYIWNVLNILKGTRQSPKLDPQKFRPNIEFSPWRGDRAYQGFARPSSAFLIDNSLLSLPGVKIHREALLSLFFCFFRPD